MILGFIGGYYTISLFSLALIITGWCAVRDSSVYNIEQVLCVVFFSGYLWVYAVVDVILYIENYSDLSIFVLLALLGGIVFYAIACAVAKLLYDELRNNYLQPGPEDMPTGILGAFGGGGGGLRNFGGFGQNNNAQQTQIGIAFHPCTNCICIHLYFYLRLRK